MSEQPAVLSATPTTFLERGVAVPFTTPQLTGARLRPGQRAGLELVVPHPAGGRGYYVLPAEMLDGYCRMTVHDRALQARINADRLVTPGSVRAAARAIAGEGLAGRPAAAAATAADRTDERARLLMNFNLMLELIRGMEHAGAPTPRLDIANAEEVERRARDAVARVAPQLATTAAHIHDVLEELAVDLLRIGRGNAADRAPLPQLLDQIGLLRHDLTAWARPAERPGAPLAQLVIDVANATLDIGRATLQQARDAAADLISLLRQRCTDPATLAQILTRPDWLLDGWDQVCLAWRTRDLETPPELLLAEIMAMLPLLPREAGRWGPTSLDLDAMEQRSRTVALNIDWRTAQPVFDMVARNEQRRAMAA